MIDLESELLKLTLKLYNNKVIPRNAVQIFIDYLIEFTSTTYACFIKEKLNLSNHECPQAKSIVKDLDNAFASSKNILDLFQSEHLRFEMYRKKNLMIMPTEYVITTKMKENFNMNNEKYFVPKHLTDQYIPLKWSLKLFLEIPGMFETIQNYVEELEQNPNIISNFIQADLWKSMKNEFKNKLVLPLFIFEDDFECGNALGSHAGMQKLGAVYASIACLPMHLATKLENIFLTLLYHAQYRKTVRSEKIYDPLIRELNYLRHEGIVININNKPIHIFFQLSLILGDNLGLNEILGIHDHFNSGRPCRICKADIGDIAIMTSESESLLRTVETYDDDCKLDTSETGIKEICVFNKVDGFHVCKNVILDLMHDFFEGLVNVTLVQICETLIYKQKLFSLDYLNSQVDAFQQNQSENFNNIPTIKKEHITIKKKFKMSSSEMIIFSKYFCLFVGEKVPTHNEVWDLYKLLRTIISYVTSPRIVEGHILQLQIIIPEFLNSYKQLFGALKYKFHNMLHIVRIIRNNGPMITYWAMRYESKHKNLKLIAVSTSSRKNIEKTLCLKNQLNLAYMKISSNVTLDKFKIMEKDTLDVYNCRRYFPMVNCNEDLYQTRHVVYNGIVYKINFYYVVDISREDYVIFGKLVNIFICKEEIFLLLKVFEKIYFDEHFGAYFVREHNTNI